MTDETARSLQPRDRCKSIKYSTIIEVQEVKERGCVCEVINSAGRFCAGHRRLAEWSFLAEKFEKI